MYKGSNPTALASQKLILDTMNKLMTEKDFKDISVSELCSRSGVSRQTFYSLFGTKENILLYHLDLINNTKPDHNDGTVMKLDDICRNYAKYVSSNYSTLKTLIENDLTEVLYQLFIQTMSACSQGFLDLTEEDKEYASMYMSAGLCRLTQKYINEHKQPDEKELTRISYAIMSGNIYRV